MENIILTRGETFVFPIYLYGLDHDHDRGHDLYLDPDTYLLSLCSNYDHVPDFYFCDLYRDFSIDADLCPAYDDHENVIYVDLCHNDHGYDFCFYEIPFLFVLEN